MILNVVYLYNIIGHLSQPRGGGGGGNFLIFLTDGRAFFKNSSVGGPTTKRDHIIPSVEK